MAIPRASAASAALGRAVFRRAATQTRTRAWRQIGRRHYASEHGGGQKSSELPWIIGSVGFTVPAAVWLFGQGPKGTPHGPEEANEERDETTADKQDPDEEAHEAKPGEAAPSKGSAQDPEHEKESTKERQAKQESDSDSAGTEESSEGGSDDSGDGPKEESKDDGKDDSKDDSEDGPDSPNAPGQINKPGPGKGPGEQQKGPRPPPELQGEKDSHHDSSGAQNPYITQNKEEKSKKGQGITDTAKIHGTVDTSRPTRGPQDDPGKRD